MERIRRGRLNNSNIAQFEDLQELLTFVDENVHKFNCVNFSTAIHRIGKLNKPLKNRRYNARRGDLRQAALPVNEDPRFHRLEAAIEAELLLHDSSTPPPLEDGRGQFGVREVASMLWGLANCGATLKEAAQSPHAPNTLRLLLKRLVGFDRGEFACQNLSNALWAIATMHQHEDEYLPLDAVHTLETHVCGTMGDFIPQGVSNCLWAFGSLNKNKGGFSIKPETVARFGEGILLNKHGFKSMELSNIVWAVSTLRLEFPSEVIEALDDAVCHAIDTQPDYFSSQSVSNVLWDTSPNPAPHSPHPEAHTPNPTPQTLTPCTSNPEPCHPDPLHLAQVSNVLWAAGNHPGCMPLSDRLLHALAAMSFDKFHTFTPQGLSNTVWGFASVGYNPVYPKPLTLTSAP
jgi:hypothetical protein